MKGVLISTVTFCERFMFSLNKEMVQLCYKNGMTTSVSCTEDYPQANCFYLINKYCFSSIRFTEVTWPISWCPIMISCLLTHLSTMERSWFDVWLPPKQGVKTADVTTHDGMHARARILPPFNYKHHRYVIVILQQTIL